MVIGVIGSGGKTTLIHQLAEKYFSEGKKVVITTTTHMFCEEGTVDSAFPEVAIEKLEKEGYCMVGTIGGHKISAPGEKLYEELCERADVVLVEADGSKHLPLKYPAEWEPALPENTDKVILVVGMFSLGQRAGDVIHRFPLAKEALGIGENQTVGPSLIENLIYKGYMDNLLKNFDSEQIEIYPAAPQNLYGRAVSGLLRDKKKTDILREEWFSAPPKLVICGAGHVAAAIEELARGVGFETTVIDDRAELANRDRYPKADHVICRDFSEIWKCLPKEDDTYFVIATKGPKTDLACLREIMTRDASYVGVLGSKKKIGMFRETLLEEGFATNRISSIHGPMGLSINAKTPAEIAVSTLAEIINVKNSSEKSYGTGELTEYDGKGVLCVIMNKEGIAPRDVGTMMIVEKDRVIGTIGGGKVESLGVIHARNVKTTEEVVYDVMGDDGFGGKITVLFVPLP